MTRCHFLLKSKKDIERIFQVVYGSLYVPCLDEEISTDEIKSGQRQLKEDKASGDGWTKKMVSNMPLALLVTLQLIYDCILKFHVSLHCGGQLQAGIISAASC